MLDLLGQKPNVKELVVVKYLSYGIIGLLQNWMFAGTDISNDDPCVTLL